MNSSQKVLRVGRLGPWQRRFSYLILGVCAASGLVWFVLLDAVGLPPPRVVPWWILHGVSALLAALVIGAALPTHVPAAWRHFRNRLLGGLTLATLGVVIVSTALLLYGQEEWHAAAHWVHALAGVFGALAFTLHAWRGRRSPARLSARAQAHTPAAGSQAR